VAETFPRTTDSPKQSPQFWVAHKDRYLRQLLIRDIEAVTGRELVVYFGDDTSLQCAINSGDDIHLAELLQATGGKPVDLMLETVGGETDATEKLCSLLRANNLDLRVVVPRRAKSNGTVVALAGTEIVMGMESELGPIDPSIGNIPVQFILNAPPGSGIGPIDIQAAMAFRKQTEKLAKDLLSTGMLKGAPAETIDQLVAKIATRDVFHSHGSVINADEAAKLGLKVTYLKGADPLWQKFILLRAMYQFDCREQGYLKMFEGSHVSVVVKAPPVTAKT
jgi:hypothetical protein